MSGIRSDIKATREKFGLTQVQFAERFNIAVGTLRDWEQGRKQPNGVALNFLRCVMTNPQFASFALGHIVPGELPHGVTLSDEEFVREPGSDCVSISAR